MMTIYKIVCKDKNIKGSYVGCTCNFPKRKYEHMHDCYNTKRNQYKYNLYQYIREHGGFDNFEVVIIEDNIKDKDDALKKERFYIDLLNPSLNTHKPFRTKQEYYKDHIEKIKQYNKDYYLKNKNKK